jgi:hypothetical protein
MGVPLTLVLGVHHGGEVEILNAVSPHDRGSRRDMDAADLGAEVGGFKAYPAPAPLAVEVLDEVLQAGPLGMVIAKKRGTPRAPFLGCGSYCPISFSSFW